MVLAELVKRVITGRSSLRLSALILLTPGAALALPEGLVVQGGSISVSQPDGSSLLIQQGTNRAAGDWQNFNIGANERVTIQQPSATSVMLARVTGGVGTEIFGQLNANGGLVLLNPYGVLIGPGAVINTANFAASTLNADPAQFMQGGALELQMQPGAPQDAAVVNRGRISVAQAGLASLVSPHVINDGLISASLGTIQIASGTAATLDLSGNGLVRVALDANASGTLLNNGQLKAQMVRIGAADAVDALSAAVNLDGVIEARGANEAGGTILVNTSGDIQVNGLLDASGGDNADGGTVKLLGDRVALLDQAVVDVSGGTGGGEALIGGNQLGQGPEPNASVAVIAPGARVKADARIQGDGGRVILWSDVYTGFYGKIAARGGSNGGNGGFIETSSKDNLQAYGSVDASATNGKGGLWLIDPTDIEIGAVTTQDMNFDAALNLWTPTNNGTTTIAYLDANALQTQLDAGTSVTITTSSTTPASSCTPSCGTISFTSQLVSSSTNAATLTLEADENIEFLDLFSLPSVSLVITKAKDVSFASGNTTTLASLNQQAGSGITSFTANALIAKASSGIKINAQTISLSLSSLTSESGGSITLNSDTGGITLDRSGANTVVGITSAADISLTSKGAISLNNAPVSGTAFVNLTAAKNITLNASSGIEINGRTSATATAGNISVTGTVTGNSVKTQPELLNLTSGGTISFANNVTGFNNITIVNSSGATFAGAVQTQTGTAGDGKVTITDTTGGVNFQGGLNAVGLTTQSKGYSVGLTGTTNTFTSAVDFANTGTVTLGDNAADTFTFSSGVGFSGKGPITLGGIITNGGRAFTTDATAAVTLAADTSITTGDANITFGGAVTGKAYNLSINPGTAKAAVFSGNVQVKNLKTSTNTSSLSLTGANNEFTDQVEFKQTGALTLGNGGDTFLFDGGFSLNGPNALSLGATIKTSGDAVDATAPITLTANSSIDTTNGGLDAGHDIKISNTIDGAQTFSLTSGKGDITLNYGIGGTTPLNTLTVNSTSGKLLIADNANISTSNAAVSLTAGGGITSGGDISTTGGKIDVNSSLTLTDNIAFNSSGGSISLNGSVTDASAGKTLAVYAGNSSSANFAGSVNIKNLLTDNKSYSLSLIGASNSFTDKVDFQSTGALTLGNEATDTFTFQSGLTFSVANPALTLAGIFTTGGNSFNPGTATVTLAANTDINSAGGAISFGGSVTGATQTLKVDGGNGGSASFTNNLQVKDLITAANNYTISLTGGTNTFTDSVEFLNTGIITLGDATGDTFTFTGGLSISGTAALNLAGAFTTTASGFAAGSRPVTLTDDTSITTAGGAISFGNTVTGTGKTFTIDAGNSSSASFSGGVQVKDLITAAKSYTIALTGGSNTFDETTVFNNTGTVTLGSSAGSATFLFSKGVDFQGNADINIGGTINAKGQALKFGTGSLTLLSNSTLTTTAGGNTSGANISLGGNLTGPTFNLTVDAGTAGAISENTINLNSLTITNAASLTIAGNATLGNLITGSNSYWIAFNGSDNKFSSGQTNQIVFDNKGTVSLGDNALDVTLFDHGFDFTSNVTGLKLGGLVHTSGDSIIAALPVTLLANTTIASTGNAAAGATINISGAINGTTTGKESLTLVSGSSTITLSGAIGNSVPIGAFTVKDTSGTLTLANTADIVTNNGAVSLTAGGGITSGADISTNGAAVTIGSKFTLSDNLTISSADGAINFNAEVTDAGNSKTLTVDAGNGGTGAATFNGNISLKNLITTTNNYSVSLIGSSNTFSDLVAFKNTKSLTLGDQATDSFSFNNGLTFSANTPAPPLTLAGIFTTGGKAFNPGTAAVTLAANTSIDTSGVSSGAISFGGAITGNTGAGQTLTINAGTSSASFSGDVKVKDLITTAGSYSVSLTGATNTFTDSVEFLNTGIITLGDAKADIFTFTGGLSISGSAAALNLAGVFTTTASGFAAGSRPVTLTDDTSITTAGGAISFGDTVTGTSKTFTIDAGNNSSASFSGDVQVKDLITATNSYTISLTGNNNEFTDTRVFKNTGTVTLGDNTGKAGFLFKGGVDFAGNAAIKIGGTINTEGQALKFGTGSPTLLSDSTLTTTAGGKATGANISLGGNLSGPNFGLTIDAGTGGAISEQTITLNRLTITNAKSLAVSGNATLSTLDTGTGSTAISFTGSTNVFGSNSTTGAGSITKFLNTGTLTLGDGGDDFLFNDGVDVNAVSSLTLGGTIRTPGVAVNISQPITLIGSGGVNTTANTPGGAPITVSGTIDGKTAGADNVSFIAGNGNINFSGAIGASTAVGSFTATTTDTLSLSAAADIKAGGAVTLSGTVGINSAADITTTGKAITIQSPFTLTGDQTISSGGGAISFAGSVTGASRTLTIDGGTNGSASFAGDVTLKALTTLANNYSVSFTGTSNTFNNAVTFLNTGALTLGNGADTFTFTGGVTATAPSGINLSGTVSAAGTGVLSLGDNDTPLTVTGTSTVGGASTGTITLGAATLADNATLTVGAGAATPINLGAVAGTAGGTASNLTLNTTGAVNVSGAVGTDIGTLTITNSGGTTFAGDVAANSLVTTANPYAITFKGASNSFTQAVDFLNSGTVSLGDAAAGGDVFLFDGGLAFTGNAAINLKGQVRSSGDAITFGAGAIALLSNSSIDATNNGANPTGGNIYFNGSINDGASSFTLDLNAGSKGDIRVYAPAAITIGTLKVSNAAPNSAIFEGNVQVDDFITTANNYSVAFTGATNTFANAVTFLNTGALTLGDGGDSFAFTGGVTATDPSAITLDGTVSAPGTAPITLGDTDTALSIAGTSTIGGTSTGAISLGAATLANKATLTVGTGVATPITLAAVSGTAGAGNSSDLTINTTAAVKVTGAVSTNIGTVTITNSGGATFAGNVQTGSLVTTKNAYAVSLTGSSNSVSQSVDFLNTGLVTLGDAAGTDLFLFDGGLAFTGSAASTIGGVIRSSGDAINFGSGGVTLLASSSVDTTNSGANTAGGPVTFGTTVNGTVGGAAEALTVTAGLGNVNFSGAVGGTDPLGAIIINTGGQTLFDSTVKALSLYTDQPGTAILNGNITSTGAAGVQINEWTIGIKSGLTIDTTSGNGTVVLGGVGGAINSVGAAQDLTISSGSGNVTLNSSIGATNPLGALAINTSGATTFNSPVTATSVITDKAGTAILNGNITASGAAGVQIQELTIGLYSPVTITSPAGPVSLGGVGGTINSEANENNDLTISAGTALTAKDVSIFAAIGGTQRLGDIVINTSGATLFEAAVTAKSISTDQPGTAALNGNIDVNGAGGVQIRELTIALNNPITINSSNGPVSLSSSGGAINSQTGETNDLTITAGNAQDVSLNAAVGGTERLGDIVINTSGATLFNAAVTAKSISTDQPGTAALNGNIDVNGAGGVQIRELTIALNDHIAINSTLGPVTLSSAGGAINSQTGETNDLIITAGANQDVTLNAALGGTQALRDVKVYTAGLTALNASITATSLFTDTPGTASLGNSSSPMVIALSGPAGAQINELLGVTLNGPVTINTTNAPLTFAGPLDSKAGTSYNFTANAGTGAITFNGPVGGTTKPYNLILTGGDININATTQAMNVTMTGGNLNWDADIISPGFGTPGVPYGYHTFVGTINLLRNVTIEGNIGLINGTREYTTPRTISGFILTPKYNDDPVVTPSNTPSEPVATVPDIPNLLNNQLNENRQQNNSPFALTGSDSDVTSSTASQSQSRSRGSTESDKDGETDPDVCIKKDGCARQAS
jgi:filamentous hemagglutinin family protein